MTGRALLLDAGSTNLKWFWWHKSRLVPGGSKPHGGAPQRLVESIPAHAVSRVLVASVLRESEAVALGAALTERFGVSPEFARAQPACCGVVNSYADPAQLGVDRWLALIAARRRGPGGRVVVDCGTAMTIDTVDAAGRHLGGQIIPGLRAMYRCLEQTTRLSPQLAEPAGLLGHDTTECVASGVHYALAAAIERAVSALPADRDDTARIVMTGGDAVRLGKLLRAPCEIRPHLVIEGLLLWAGLDDRT
jgi:type III pantothenate kinase